MGTTSHVALVQGAPTYDPHRLSLKAALGGVMWYGWGPFKSFGFASVRMTND